MNKLLEKTFENRGYDSDFFDNIVLCNHHIPNGVDAMCKRLKDYHDNSWQIVLVTDFDVDGLMCGVEGLAGFAELGFQVALYLPTVSYGYGFDSSDIERIRTLYPDAKAIITGDVGITAYDGVSKAKELGMEVFVTDHHKASGVINADFIVNPQCDDVDYGSYPLICGSNVLYQILRYYAEYYTDDNKGYYMQQMDRLRVFAGFGTISDGMPLYHENRPLVSDAVNICRMLYGTPSESPFASDSYNFSIVNLLPGCDIYRRAFRGLYMLLLAFVNIGKLSQPSDIDEDFIGYYIAPMFNSIKRMDDDVSNAYDIFFGSDEQSFQCIQYLFELNDKRKTLVAKKFEELQNSVQPWSPYVYITDASKGIRGLLAQKVLLETGLPVLVIAKESDSTYSGSGRCPSWFPFLKLCKHDGWWSAGHDVAFGFESGDVLDDLVKFLECQIDKVKPSDEDLQFKPDFVISSVGDGDADLDLDLLEDYLYELNMYKPFGKGFPKPQSMLRFYSDDGVWHVIGKEHNHVKIDLSNGMSILCFFQADLFANITGKDNIIDSSQLPDVIELVGCFSFNDFMDVRTLQFLGDITNIDEPIESLD